MHKTVILLGSLLALCGTWTPVQARCASVVMASGQVATSCDDSRPLRLASAVLAGPPLIWSTRHAALVPLPAYGSLHSVGRTIPIGEVIGRRVLPLTNLPQPVVYNNPDSFPSAVDPGVVLMPLPSPRRVVIRRAYLQTKVIRVKD